MNKVEIKRYLGSQQDLSTNVIIIQRNAAIEAERIAETANIFKDVDLKAVNDATDALVKALKPYVTTVQKTNADNAYNHKYSRLYSIAQALEHISNDKDYLKSYAKGLNENYNSKKPSELQRNYTIARNKVDTEFRKILGNISKMNAKEATEYIVGLGFILPDESAPIANAVLAPIDVKMLQSLRDAMPKPVGTDVENEDWQDNTEA